MLQNIVIMLLNLVTVTIIYLNKFNMIANFQTDSTKNLQYTDHNYKIYGGPDVIRTRDPRHVKAVS
jgi:hypothetical protein